VARVEYGVINSSDAETPKALELKIRSK